MTKEMSAFVQYGGSVGGPKRMMHVGNIVTF